MSAPNPKILVPVLLVLAIGAAGIWYETGRRNQEVP